MAVERIKFLNRLDSINIIWRTLSTETSRKLTIKKIGSITCIGINRPEKKNCLNLTVIQELNEAIQVFENDESSNAAVLFGERGNFSNGLDPDEFRQNPNMIESIEKIGLFQKYPLKPVVAAVSGFAASFGFDLALWADFRVVEDTARMGGYARRFGMPVSDTTVRRMHSLLGLHKAMDLLLTGRFMNSKEALESGIATRVVACGTGLGQAVNFAHSLTNMPQACLKADRAALISLTNKFCEQTNEFIVKEREIHRLTAIKEAEEGVHITESGDVRVKT